jgi:hypothetical protein
MTLGKNLSLPLLSRTQLLQTFPYLQDNLVIVGEKNPRLLAPASTILLPSHLTCRHPRDREGVQCNLSEGVQEHGEGEQQRERRPTYGPKDKWFPTRCISSPVGKTVGSVLPLSHLTSSTPTKSILYFIISHVTVSSGPALYSLYSMCQIIFLGLGRRSKETKFEAL